MELTLLVLAAGVGSRYGGLKQIQPVGPGGEAILDYSIYDAMRAGFSRVVFVIRKDIESAFRETLGARFESRLPVDYVFQDLSSLPAGFQPPAGRTKPWGTGHAVLVAADAIQGPFAAINADDFYGAQSYRVLADCLSSAGPDEHAMVGYVLRNTLSEHGSVSRGVCTVGADGMLQGVRELTRIERAGQGAGYVDGTGAVQPLTGDEIVSLNMWGFQPGVFGHLERQFVTFLKQDGQEPKSEFYIPTAVARLIREQQARVRVLTTPDSWFGVTYREDHPGVARAVQALLAAGKYPAKLL